MRKPKWNLLTELSESGFLALVRDLDHLYKKFREFDNAHLSVRMRNGKYDVNVLTKDWDEMMTRQSESEFLKRYREDVK